ncbi:hypothetical protein PBRA_008389 [Plasmodiophora brassicae]|uniref:GH18 domain-containing protein n=1 Tax=Plasmodiophora brassicae TaxID=37360 RepID=A0A0G4J0L5_PLABS|nr:hypothetical protein PBRA_008389 [Plasmodiophora brassicae]
MNCSISATGPGTTSHIIGFVLNYKTSVLPIASINGALFTEIVYQGFDIVEGRCAVDNAWFDTQQTFGSNALGDDTNAATPYRGNFYQLRLLKQQAGNAGRLRTLVSIGGYSFSTNVSVIAASDAGRHLLASSCTQLARYYGFDGVEIRWQYPVMGGAWMNVHSPADKANLPLLLAAFRTEDPGLLLTANVNFNAGTLYPRYDLAGIANQVDWIHADTFGLYGTWSTSTAHYANLFFTVGSPSSDTVDGLVVQALAAGVPPCKFILGVPLSYPAWKLTSNVPASFPALFAPGTTYTAGATDNGLFRYRDAMQLCSGAPSSCTVVWDASSNASVLYDPSSLVWIPVESAQTMAAKAAYIAANNLGGVIFTDVSGDTSAFDIVTAMQVALKGSAPCLGQPAYVPSGGAVPSYARQAPGACAPVRASSTSGGMATPALQTATRVIGRYASYKDAYLPVAAIDGSLLTHVIYESAGANASWQCQFASPVNDLVRVFGANTLGNDTGDPYHGDVNQLRRLKLKYPHLTTILQLGQNVMFSSLVSDAGRRSAFVSSCVAMMQQYGFDGLNVNWSKSGYGAAGCTAVADDSPMLGASYQNDPHLPTDRTQLPVLMQMFRAQMPPGALLSLTVTVQADTMYAAYDLPAIVPHVDFIEYANEWMWGTWSPVPGHLNPLHFNAASPEYYSIEANVVQLLNWGVPHCKLVLGLPVYGAAWNLSAPIPGPFYPGVFAATGSAYATGATDVAQHYRYGDLLALRQAATPGAWLDQWDPVSQAAFLYNAGSGIVVSYENPASIAAKAAFVKVMALGGFAVDDLDADADNFALLHSAVRAMLVVPAPSTRAALDAVHAFISGWAAPLSASARMATSLTTASCLRVLSREGEVPRAAQVRYIGRMTSVLLTDALCRRSWSGSRSTR